MQMHITRDELRPLVRAVVAEVLAELEARMVDDGRLAFSEAEAADLLGIRPHVLRDARLRGEITACRIAGGRVRYTRHQLLEYLLSHTCRRPT